MDAAKELLASVPLPPTETRTLRLLGAERLEIGGVESDHDDWRRERVRSLVGYLVVHPDATSDAVMTALWPEANEEAARRSLRSTLNLLLGVLEEGRAGGDAAYFVRADRGRVRLAGHDRLDVDVWRFDSLLNEATQLEADGAPSLALDCLTEAIDLYRGGLLSGIVEGEWLHLERQRLHVRFVGAAVRGAELLLAHNRADEAIALATRTLQIEPWSEPTHRSLVAGHLQRGDRAAAHRAMQQCHEMLADLGGPVDELTEMLERRLTGS
ncbi:MAG: BTAD domain-containing putative transcriptional regulator [Acidimicrobiales bacterium]|jgi:DNA-binding SARP family transcriptional activator|nr:BTAD domain-containing putative transcriptional regulator [Acidimicrobiales bacterium]